MAVAEPGQQYYIADAPAPYAVCSQCAGRVWAPYECIYYPAEREPVWFCYRHLPAAWQSYIRNEQRGWRHTSHRPCSDIQQSDPLRACAVTFALHEVHGWPAHRLPRSR